MPDDIEDFLKRAAQRRQNKSGNQPMSGNAPAAPVKPLATPRPEYTSARTERIPRNRGDAEPLQAILIEDDAPPAAGVAKHMETLKRERAKATSDADVKRAGGTVKPFEPSSVGNYVVPDRAPSVAPQTMTGDNAGFTVADRLITMLRQPEGMMQAILLQEILNRPEHRW